MVLGGVLCTGALFAALLCVMLRLDRLEKKLDALISSKEGADRPRAAQVCRLYRWFCSSSQSGAPGRRALRRGWNSKAAAYPLCLPALDISP